MAEGSFGKYFFLKKLASGGMGEVFLAKQQGPEGFEKTLVVKRILSHHTDNHDYVDMFFSEARLAAKMSHANIVQIYEMGEIDGSYYIAMEFVNGKSIKDLIDNARGRNLPLHPAHIAEVISRLCAGLGYAHALTDMSGSTLNIIHRDINPHNVLVSYQGDIKIIDFGIAKSEMNEHKTETGTIKGKFVYMSPEQSAAEKIDQRSDIFSIGIVLYEMLAGENPFQKANIVLSLDAIQRMEPPPPSALNPDFAPFDAIVQKALAKKPESRYQHCSEMAADLDRALLLGEIPRAPKPLAAYMTELFKEHIEKEQRFIQEASQSMQAASGGFTPRPSRPQPGSFAPQGPREPPPSPEVSLQNRETGAHQLSARTNGTGMRRRKSRIRLYSILGGIVVAASVAIAVILVGGGRPREAPSVAVETFLPAQANIAPVVPPPPARPVAQPAAPPTSATSETHESSRNQNNNDKKNKRDKRSLRDARVAVENDSGSAVPTVVIVDAQPEQPKPAPQPRPEPKPAAVHPAVVAAPRAAGYFLINATPQAAVFRDGRALGSSGAVRVDVSGASGIIRVGDASSLFQISLQYRISGGQNVELQIDAKPWAILKKGGISLGKTPRPWIPSSEGPQRFEFLSPAVQGSMTVVVRYYPSN